MKHGRLFGAIAQAVFVFITIAAMALAPAPTLAEEHKTAPAPTRRLYGQINAFGAACVSSGVIPLSTQLPTTVEEVKAGSPAFYAGVVKGDKILQAAIETNRLQLQIERQGHIYLVKMRAKTDNSVNKLSTGTTTFSLGEQLRGYRIKLIVDHSGSMCRALGNKDKTRWEWVVEEVSRFCREAEKQAGSTFDLCLFSEEAVEVNAVSAKKVSDLLNDAVTTGNTKLTPALKASLGQQSPGGKPLLVLLVTDGQCMIDKGNADILANAFSRTSDMRKSKFIFLQAGFSEEGTQFMTTLKQTLSGRGIGQAASMILFEEVSDKGVMGAVESLIVASKN